MVLTRKELESFTCADCGAPLGEHVTYLSSVCCDSSEVHVIYYKGVLFVRCAQCGKNIVAIAVAE